MLLHIDDTRDCKVLSSFDPVRRDRSKVALENLIARSYSSSSRQWFLYKKAGGLFVNAERVLEAGLTLHLTYGAYSRFIQIVTLLVSFSLPYFYGQNVLAHSVQVAHFARHG